MTDTTKQFDPIEHTLKRGAEYPYHGQEPKTWAEVAACAILYDLTDRRGIKHALREIDNDVRAEIVESLAKYIARAAAATPSPVPAEPATAELPPLTRFTPTIKDYGDGFDRAVMLAAEDGRWCHYNEVKAHLASRPAPVVPSGEVTVAEQRTQAGLEESLAIALAEHTDISTDGIDEYVPRMIAVIPTEALPFKIVPTEGIDPSWYAAPVAAVPEDFHTHRESWRDAIKIAIEHGEVSRIEGIDDKAYWRHELAAFDRAYAGLAAKPDQSAQEVKCGTCNGTGVVDDGEIDCYPNGEPFMCGPIKCVKDCPKGCASPEHGGAGCMAVKGECAMDSTAPATPSAAQAAGVDKLHSAIINLPCSGAMANSINCDELHALLPADMTSTARNDIIEFVNKRIAVAKKEGHRDARHAAAELVVAYFATTPSEGVAAPVASKEAVPAPATVDRNSVIEECAKLCEQDSNEDLGHEELADLIRSRKGKAAPAQPSAEQVRDSIRDAVSQSLTSVYFCGRVWSAWQVGTMSEDDFTPASESDEVLDEITDRVMTALHASGEKGADRG